MYEDSWYSFTPDTTKKGTGTASSSSGHKRRQSLLQQPNGGNRSIIPLDELLEQTEDNGGPPQATVPQRAKSYSDFHTLTRPPPPRRREPQDSEPGTRTWSALHISNHDTRPPLVPSRPWDSLGDSLVGSSIEEYTLYHDQLTLTQQHLATLVADTNTALTILASLSDSFKAVQDQTSMFQDQCHDLLSSQKHLQSLSNSVASDLHYYAYLEAITRRLNAPGASRLAEDEGFDSILTNLDACTAFMKSHPQYRDAESYQARYEALVTKALHLLETTFTASLDRISLDLGKQILATTSDSARHALAYGRFQELLLECRNTVPNVHDVILRVFHPYGSPAAAAGEDGAGNVNRDIYANTVQNLFNTYLGVRDRDLRPIILHDVEEFKADATSKTSPETACRNFLKQSFERAWNEFGLFKTVFAVEPHFSNDDQSAFAMLKVHTRQVVNIGNLGPVANAVQPVLQGAGLDSICNVVGWLTNEYLMIDPDDEVGEFVFLCQELTARLLSEHLWAFTDAAFEVEVAKVGKAAIALEALKLPQTGGGKGAQGRASAGQGVGGQGMATYPLIGRAVELLGLFDGCMPKERCQKSSPVIFHLIQTAISALQKAEGRLRSTFKPNLSPFSPSSPSSSLDPDLFMVKNLLALKHSLISLEIGDVRDSEPEHFGRVWDALAPATNLIGWVGSFLPTPWRRDSSNPGGAARPSSSAGAGLGGSAAGASGGAGGGFGGVGTGAAGQEKDASEILDELLRKFIIGFTQRWAGKMHEAKKGGKDLKGRREVEVELDKVLVGVFGGGEVVGKLKEAVWDVGRGMGEKGGR